MRIAFYGVRGSVPVPGPHTAKYGGNTSCVEIVSSNGARLILDAGTGLIKLGDKLLHVEQPIHILLTHNHWDHIQGFPFFKPIYKANRSVNVYPGQVDADDIKAVLNQMGGSTFPVHYQDLPCKLNFDSNKTKQPKFNIEDFEVSTKPLNHPGGGTGYVIKTESLKVAYITDNELSSPNAMNTSMADWVDFVKGADLLIHDAQFLDQEMPQKSGWGHSTIHEVADLAVAAKVKHLALISHDPCRSDTDLDDIESYLKQLLKDQNSNVVASCAFEGQVYQL